MIQIIELSELDQAEWNIQEVWNSFAMASHLIKHPELVSRDARFEAMEYVLPVKGFPLRIDLLFEDTETIYLVECESSRNRAITGNNEYRKMMERIEKYKAYFLESYSGGKKVEAFLVVPFKQKGSHNCPSCGRPVDKCIPKIEPKFGGREKRTIPQVGIVNIIDSHGPLKRQDLYRITSSRWGLCARDLDSIISQLKEGGAIIEYTGVSTGGRRPIMYRAAVEELGEV